VLPKERYCHFRKPGCKIKFKPRGHWDRGCSNPACQEAERVFKSRYGNGEVWCQRNGKNAHQAK